MNSVSFSGKPVPVAGKRHEEIVQDRLRPMPGAAVVWRALRLGPFDLRIKQREDGADVAAAEGVVEAANSIDGRGHKGLRVHKE
jgi:hypothetical protein